MRFRLFIVGLLLAPACPASALEYRSTAQATILYDAPSTLAGKVAIAGSGLPLEVIVKLQHWVKVRDHNGRLTWVEKSVLNGTRSVMIKTESSVIRQRPRPDAGIVFRAVRGVLLEPTGKPDEFGWLPVRHADGRAGWLPAHEVWGR